MPEYAHCLQTVHGLAALALAVPVIFHWYVPPEDEERMPDWASTGLDWKGRIQMMAFCFFEVSRFPSQGRPPTH